MKSILTIFLIITAVGGIIAVAFLGFEYLKVKRLEVTNEARFQCSQSSRYQVNLSQQEVVWYPVKEMYQECLKEKGL